jgi:dTDP-4-dehydrorhamnose reductase
MTTGNKTWLVTGASGFLGSNFAGTALISDNLIAMTRTGALPFGFTSAVSADLQDENSLREAVRETRPDYILHAAALASHEECERDPGYAFRINEWATRILAEESENDGAKFIYVSTDAVFDGATGDYRETDDTNPISVYGESKLLGEVAAMQATDAVIIRTNFFGWSPTGTRSILEFFVNNLENGNPVNGFTDFTVTSLYVRRLAAAFHDLKNQTGVWHVASIDALSKYAFGVEVANVFGLDAELITPTAMETEVPRGQDISLNTNKAQDFLRQPGVTTSLITQRQGIIEAFRDRSTTV